MTYPFPPIYWYSFDSVVWQALMWSFWLVSGGLTLAAIIYFHRVLNGGQSAKWMVFAWLLALLIEITLVIPIGLIAGLNNPLAIGYVPALMGAAGALLHCLIAIESSNVRVKEQASSVGCGVLATGVMIVSIFWAWQDQVSFRNAPPRSQCKNNLKQVGLAFHNWADAHDGRFTDAIVRDDGRPPHSWRIELLPYIDEAPLFNEYDQSLAWNSAANIKFAQRKIRVYQCPALPEPLRQNDQGQVYTAYATVIGKDTLFPDGKGTRLREIEDGTSNTALVVEACGQQIVWSEPRDIEMAARNVGINLPSSKPNQSRGVWSSFHGLFHSRGAHVLLADGSVRWISKDTDLQVLNALLTRKGGETVGDF